MPELDARLQAEQAARQQAERAVQRVGRMQTATAALSAASTVRQVAATITEQVASALGAEGAIVALISPDGEWLETIGAAGLPQDLVDRWARFPVRADAPMAVAVRTNAPQWPETVHERLAQYPHLRDEYAPAPDASWLSIPLLLEGRSIGGLSVRFAVRREFDAEDRAYAQALSALAAQALDRARLFEAERAARQRAEAAAARTASLQSITAAMSRAMTPAEVAEVVIRYALPGVRAAAGAVGILVDDTTIELVASMGYPESMTTALRTLSIDASTPMAEAVRTGQPAWRDQSVAPDRFADYARVNPYYSAGAGIPLAVDGRVLGGLGLSFVHKTSFEPAEREFMLALGALGAQALERSRLYEAELRSREHAERTAAQLEAILGGVAEAITAQAPDGSIVYANAAAAAALGYADRAQLLRSSQSQILGRFEILDEHGEPLAGEAFPFRRALRGEAVHEFPMRFRVRSSGEERWSVVSAVPVNDATGNTVLAISIFRDITERRRALERTRLLAQTGALLPVSLDLDSTLDGVVSTIAGSIADCCGALLIAPGPGQPEVEKRAIAHADPALLPAARTFFERYPPDGPSAVGDVLKGGPPLLVRRISDEMLLRVARDDVQLQALRQLNFASSIFVPLAARGHVLGVLTLFTAGTRRRFDSEDLRVVEEIARRAALAIDNVRLYEAAQQAIRARDDFLSIAAHELRTPITALKGVAQLLLRALERGQLAEQRLERHLRAVETQATRLGVLTDDLLDVSRLRTARLELRLQTFDLCDFLTAAIDRYRDTVGDDHDLLVDLTATCPVRADPDRLEQVLSNVLSNAAKYSAAATAITLRLSASEGGALVEVTDHGIGLPPGSEEAIFEPFGRAANATQRHIPGMGLGLHISREIVARHAGRMWATSPGEDQGTTISIWLPCA